MPETSESSETIKALATNSVKKVLFTDKIDDPNQAGPSGMQTVKLKHHLEIKEQNCINEMESKHTKNKKVSLEDIRPLPNANRAENGRTKEKKITARIITGTPLKKEMEEKERLVREIEERRNQRKAKQSQKAAKDKKIKQNKTSVKHNKGHVTGEAETNCEVIACPGCSELYQEPLNEDWIQCTSCSRWWHEQCSNFDCNHYFICDLCC